MGGITYCPARKSTHYLLIHGTYHKDTKSDARPAQVRQAESPRIRGRPAAEGMVMQRLAQATAVDSVCCVALLGMAVIGLAVPGSLTGGLAPACWAAICCGLAVRSLFVLSPGLGGRQGEGHGQLVPVPVDRHP